MSWLSNLVSRIASNQAAASGSLAQAPGLPPGFTPTTPALDAVLDASVALAEPFEGFSSHPYRCPAGVWTIGYGSTHDLAGKAVCETTPLVTQAEAQVLAKRDMRSAVQTVVSEVRVALTADQEAALADFVYNLGSGAFKTSTLLVLVNQGKFEQAAVEILKWDHASGQVLAGLLRRRQAEAALLKG